MSFLLNPGSLDPLLDTEGNLTFTEDPVLVARQAFNVWIHTGPYSSALEYNWGFDLYGVLHSPYSSHLGYEKGLQVALFKILEDLPGLFESIMLTSYSVDSNNRNLSINVTLKVANGQTISETVNITGS